MSKIKILVLGGVSYDTILHMDAFSQPEARSYFLDSLHETVGSTGSGKALNLNRLGLDVRLHGIIGDDVYGRLIQDYFDKEDIKFFFDIAPKGTQRHVNLMNATGDRISYMTNITHEPEIDLERICKKIDKCDHIVINIMNYCRNVIPYAKQQGKTIWTDLHDFDGVNPYHTDFIEGADYITFSSDKHPDYRGFMKSLMERGKKLVVCTHGSSGSTALTSDGRWIETPIIECPLVDSNGAGDSFFAGLMYGVLKGFEVEKALKLGTIVACLCVQSTELTDTKLTERKLAKAYETYYGEAL